MKFLKSHLVPPRIQDIIVAAGMHPRSPLQVATWPNGLEYPCKTFTSIAKAINSTPAKVKKTILAAGADEPADWKNIWKP